MNDGLTKPRVNLTNAITALLTECKIDFTFGVSSLSAMRTDNFTFNSEDKKHKITFTIVNNKEGFFTVENVK